MLRSELVSLEVYTDGGALNNGNANGSGVVNCYGSYLVIAVTKDGKQVPVKHEEKLPMPHLKTNNEAEYQSFINGATYVTNLFDRMGNKPVPVVFKIDSKILFDQITGVTKCKAQNLQGFNFLAKEAIRLLEAKMERISGNEMKVILGH